MSEAPVEAEPPLPGNLRVETTDRWGALSPAAIAWLDARLVDAARALGVGGEVRIAILDDRAMGAAHERWSGIPSPTDVLTFDLREPGTSAAAPLDVEVLLGGEVACRQAAGRGYPVERELLLYGIHALLHCLGYDDHDDAGFAAMHAEEDRILDLIGVGRTFTEAAR